MERMRAASESSSPREFYPWVSSILLRVSVSPPSGLKLPGVLGALHDQPLLCPDDKQNLLTDCSGILCGTATGHED